jgi:hypothetical protein
MGSSYSLPFGSRAAKQHIVSKQTSLVSGQEDDEATSCSSAELPPLTEDFAHGWRSLLDELKIEVLSHNLVLDQLIFNLRVKSDWIEVDECEITYLHHMALGPEIASLAQAVFFEKDTIGADLDYPHERLLLPPRHVCRYIRRMVWPMIYILMPENWFWLEQLAKGAYGFTGLQHIQIDVDCPDFPFELERYSDYPTNPVHLLCKATITYVPERRRDPRYLPERFVSSEDNERNVRRLISFAK